MRFGRTGLNVPRVHELTFLRRDRLETRESAQFYLPLMPHPEDIEVNVDTVGPLFLSDDWFVGRQLPAASRARKHQLLAKFAGHSIDELRRELLDMDDRLYHLERRLDELHWISVTVRFIKRIISRFRRLFPAG